MANQMTRFGRMKFMSPERTEPLFSFDLKGVDA